MERGQGWQLQTAAALDTAFQLGVGVEKLGVLHGDPQGQGGTFVIIAVYFVFKMGSPSAASNAQHTVW